MVDSHPSRRYAPPPIPPYPSQNLYEIEGARDSIIQNRKGRFNSAVFLHSVFVFYKSVYQCIHKVFVIIGEV